MSGFDRLPGDDTGHEESIEHRLDVDSAEAASRAKFETLREDLYARLEDLLDALEDADLYDAVEGARAESRDGGQVAAVLDAFDGLEESLRHDVGVVFYTVDEMDAEDVAGADADAPDRSGDAMDLALAADEMHSRVESFDDRVQGLSVARAGTSAVQTAKTALSRWTQRLRGIVRGVSRTLWSLLSGLLSPSEWTLSGELGQQVLGLKGTVGVDVTFR
jgi:hypothetical protein